MIVGIMLPKNSVYNLHITLIAVCFKSFQVRFIFLINLPHYYLWEHFEILQNLVQRVLVHLCWHTGSIS